MADFNALEALINAHIKKNGVQAITGNILNGILRGMVAALGKGYTIAGSASPSTDPGTMTGPLAYIAYTAGTYTHFGGLEVEQGEVAMLIYNEAEWHKEVLFSLAASATIDGNVGTPEVGVSFVDGQLTFDFRNMKGAPGNNGAAAGFGTVTAAVDGTIGTPGVSVQTDGPDTAKNIAFQFTGLKGETGVTSVIATVDNTSGTPQCAVSLNGQQLTLAFTGLKGAQGDTGVSADYPITIVNNLTTNDPTSALSAAQGVVLDGKVSQLEAKMDDFVPGKVTNLYDENATLLPGYINASGNYVTDADCLTASVPIKKGVVYSIGLIGVGPFSSLWIAARSNGQFVQIHNEDGNYDADKLTYGTAIRTFSVNHDNPSVMFTVKFTNTQDARQHIALIEGGVADFPSVYVPYNIYIKKANIDPVLLAEIASKPEYELEQGKNLINPAIVQLNKYVSYTQSGLGTTQPDSHNGAACSGLIPVTAGKTYYLSRGASSVFGSSFCFIKEDGVSSTTPLDPSTNTDLSVSQLNNKSRAYKAPSDAKYALICLALSGWTDTETQIVGYQFEEGDTPSAYVPYVAPKEVVPVEHIPSEITDEIEKLDEDVNGEKDNIFAYSDTAGAVSYIKSPFDSANDFKASFNIKRVPGVSGGDAECFSFVGTHLVNKTTGVETQMDGGDDDICPVNFYNGGYLGANHGWDKFYKVTATGHGKDYVDIGSVYSDGSNSFVIVDIIDTNNLILAGESTDTYPIWNTVPAVTTGTYTHTSGGTNTGNIVATAVAVLQGKPAIVLDDTIVSVDGKRISENGTYKFKDTAIISQNYKIANYSSVLNVLKANVGNYTDHPAFSELEGVEYCVKLSISYIYKDAAHLFVAQSITFLQTQEYGFFGFIQKSALGADANTKLYIPKALPINGVDFRTNPVYAISQGVYITSDYWENPVLPPDRFIVSNNSIAVSGGYLFDYGVGGDNRKDSISTAFFLNQTTKKIYPRGIDRAKLGNTQVKGKNYSAVCFRNFSPIGNFNQGGKLLADVFEYNNALYIYADFNAVGIYEVEIPEEYIGCAVNVFEKSANVSLLTKIASNTILLSVETASPLYGYFVAQLRP